MDYDLVSDLVFGVVIASMVILRVVWIVNGRGIGSLTRWGRWEPAVYLGAFAGVEVLHAFQRPGALRWLIAALLVSAAIGFALRPPRSKSVNAAAPNSDGPPEQN